MIPIIITNCEYFLGRQADVHVISEYDAQTDTWMVHAVHFIRTMRFAVATGTSKTYDEALQQLHRATAQKVREFNTATGILQRNVKIPPFPPSFEQRVLVTLEDDSDATPASDGEASEVDDVISLSSEDEDSDDEADLQARQPSPINARVDIRHRSEPSGSHADEADNICGFHPFHARRAGPRSEAVSPCTRPDALSRVCPAAETPADAGTRPVPSCRRTLSRAPPEDAGRRPPRRTRSLQHAGPTIERHLPMHPLHVPPPPPPTSRHFRPAVLSIMWSDRTKPVRFYMPLPMLTHSIRQKARAITLSRTDLNLTGYGESNDATGTTLEGTAICTTISRVVQEGRELQIPPKLQDLSSLLDEDGVPQFDIEVTFVQPEHAE